MEISNITATTKKILHSLHRGCLVVVALLILFSSLVPNQAYAESVSTSVTVGNSAPSFTAGPAENPASTDTNPTNVGDDVTFEATASDSNNEDYYLIVCQTGAVSATNGGAPTCPGGQWCVSSATSSDSQATCSYTVQSGDTNENYDWYAFVCDGNASAASCSSADQGSGDSGSSFSVNHAPAFTAVSNDGPADPGDDVIWTTTSSDSDTAGTADTVKLVVCKTAGISGDDCDGGASDRWCQSSFGASDPSCTYSVPTPTADSSNDAYAYIVDNHNFASDGAQQGTNDSFAVNNVAPVVSSVTLNGGVDISLTEGTTTGVVLGATITDNNSCSDISTVTGSLYRSSITYSGCDINGEDDNNNCYAVITCSVGGGNTCDGASDASASYTCTVNVEHFADPTDANTTYSAQNWLNTIVVTDDDAASHNLEVTTGVEMESLVAMDVTSAINFGSLSVGEANDPLDQTTTVTATGNVGLDQELSGTDMDDGGANTIPVEQQEYALASSTSYGAGTDLTSSATEVELNCSKTTSGTDATKDTWWGIEIPENTVAGSYSGTNTITAIKGEFADW